MITVQDIVTLLEGLAPPALAESWDNVGLLCGDRAREVTNVLCSLDITEQVVAEATERGAQMIVGDLCLNQTNNRGRCDWTYPACRDPA